jgi:putative membrane protein
MKHYFFTFLAVLFLFSCQQNPNPSSQNDLDQIEQKPKEQALENGANNEFAAQAAIGSMMEVESSAHMIKLTENRDVQNLATIMVKDHTMAQKELTNIAKQQQLFLPQTLPPTQKAMLMKLDSLKEDQRNLYYAKLMVMEHEKAVKLFETASKSEQDKKLSGFASAKLPILKHHLAEARKVYQQMQKISPDKGDFSIKISETETVTNP